MNNVICCKISKNNEKRCIISEKLIFNNKT